MNRIMMLIVPAVVLAGFVSLLFRFIYNSFNKRPEAKIILKEKRVYFPVTMGSFIFMFWVLYALLPLHSIAMAFIGALLIFTAMVPVFKAYLLTSWQNSNYLTYAFILSNVLVFFALVFLLAALYWY